MIMPLLWSEGRCKVCLAKAYLNNKHNEPVLQDISYIRLQENRVELETLFGQEKVIPGRVIEIDFSTSKIFIEPYHTAGNA
jgi:predicted RNA-binding protein